MSSLTRASGGRDLSADLQAAFDEGFECGILDDCWSGECPYGLDRPGAREAWLQGYIRRRGDAGFAGYAAAAAIS